MKNGINIISNPSVNTSTATGRYLPNELKAFKEIDNIPKINISKGSHYLFSITGKNNIPLLAFKSSEDGVQVGKFFFKGKEIETDKLVNLLESLEY